MYVGVVGGPRFTWLSPREESRRESLRLSTPSQFVRLLSSLGSGKLLVPSSCIVVIVLSKELGQHWIDVFPWDGCRSLSSGMSSSRLGYTSMYYYASPRWVLSWSICLSLAKWPCLDSVWQCLLVRDSLLHDPCPIMSLRPDKLPPLDADMLISVAFELTPLIPEPLFNEIVLHPFIICRWAKHLLDTLGALPSLYQ